jgi:uncharacterized protein YicC (UPF0701 family)
MADCGLAMKKKKINKSEILRVRVSPAEKDALQQFARNRTTSGEALAVILRHALTEYEAKHGITF